MLSIPASVLVEPLFLIISNTWGQILDFKKINQSMEKIDLNLFSNGIYIVSIKSNSTEKSFKLLR